MRSSRSWITVAFFAGAGVALPAPPAAACANAVAEAEDPGVGALREADKALDDGDPERAYDVVLGAFDGVMALAPSKGESPDEFQRNRALRIAALALIRTDGGVAGGRDRAASLGWARHTLSRLAALRDGPLQQTDFAEARETTDPDEARAALERLAERDVVATPSGYGTLSRLRGRDHDERGRASALARCEKMATTATICESPTAPSALHGAQRLIHRRWKLGLALASVGALAAWLLSRRRETPEPIRRRVRVG